MEAQLVQAVEIASSQFRPSDDPTLPKQALEFLEQLRALTHESWSAGWSVFAARNDAGDGPRYSEHARMFGLSLVADFLENSVAKSADPAGSISFLQEAAVGYIHAEFVSGRGEGGISYIKNKLAQTLANLVLQSYCDPATATLLSSLLTLIRSHSVSSSNPSAAPLNPITTDLVLRILHDLSLNLGSDITLRAVRTKERLQRDAVVRDEIRLHSAPVLIDTLWSIVEEGLQRAGDAGNASGFSTSKAVELTEMAISVVGDYVSWLDISLMITPKTVQLFYAVLQLESISSRKAAADALLEVVLKGMKPEGKMELLRVLDITALVERLEVQTRVRDSSSVDIDSLVDLRERLAKLVNGVTLELTKILEEATSDHLRTSADQALSRSLPIVFAFMADEYDEPSECVLSGIHALLSYYKKVKKRLAPGQAMEQGQLDALAQLVDIALRKMKYDDDAEWTGAGTFTSSDDDGFSDDDEARFLELRKQLQTVLGAVASIEEGLFTGRVRSLIIETLDAVRRVNSGASVTWQQAEVALFAAYFFVEVLINATGQVKTGVNVNAFVQLPGESATKAKNKLANSVYPTLPLNALGETIQALAQSDVSSFNHPAVQLQFFECLNRYSTFFIARPDQLGSTLFAFLDSRGIHNPHAGLRLRIWYLFSRFSKEIALVIPHEYMGKILSSLKDLLVVDAALPDAQSDEDPLLKASDSTSEFDSQLYLFESAGCLISQLRNEPQEQLVLLRGVCEPLMNQLQLAVQKYGTQGRESGLREVLQAHHLMLALANVAQGFPDLGNRAPTASDEGWIDAFKTMTEQILVALSALNEFPLIREASRSAFARIVATTGPAILPFIPDLIRGLLGEITSPELCDFLSFLGLIVAKYKIQVASVLDELLLVLVQKIFHFLNQEIAGTDDAVERASLQKGYIAFLLTLVSSGLDSILISERNRERLQTILQSVVFYATNGESSCQRASFVILTRLIILWAGVETSEANGATNGNQIQQQTVPGFENFVYDTMVPLAFEVPAQSTFDFSDAQVQMVLSEIATLLKTVLTKRPDGELAAFLTEVYFPRIQCPPHVSQDFIVKLREYDNKKFKSYLQGFITASRGG